MKPDEPDDDDEPVTEEWIKTLKWCERGADPNRWPDEDVVLLFKSPAGIRVLVDTYSGHVDMDFKMPYFHKPTKGHVRLVETFLEDLKVLDDRSITEEV